MHIYYVDNPVYWFVIERKLQPERFRFSKAGFSMEYKLDYPTSQFQGRCPENIPENPPNTQVWVKQKTYSNSKLLF